MTGFINREGDDPLTPALAPPVRSNREGDDDA